MDALDQFLDSVRDAPFKWGEHDCAMFAARAVDAMHGTAYEAAVAAFGARSERDYRTLLRAGRSLEEMTRSVLGDPVIRAIRRGDVVLVGKGRRASLGIAVPPVALVAGDVGVLPVALAHVTRIWEVGG